MLFLLAMEPQHRLFKRARELGMLTKIGKRCEAFRISLYADDATVFIWPTKHGLSVTNHILVIFAKASGLITNLGKTGFYPIQCGSTYLSFLTSRNLAISTFPANTWAFPFILSNHLGWCCNPLSKRLAKVCLAGKGICSLILLGRS
jgi:hypothetical protein